MTVLVVGPAAAAEKDLPALIRTWRAAGGKFEVEATLVERGEREVTLQKKDGQVITVPLEKLSQADQNWLRSLPQREGSPKLAVDKPQASKIAPAGTFVPEKGKTLTLAPGPLPRGLAPDPQAAAKPLPEGGFNVAPRENSSDSFSQPILLNAEKGLVAVALTRKVVDKPNESRGQIFVGTLPSGPPRVAWDAPAALKMLDYDAASDSLLIVDRIDHFGHGGDIVLLTGVATGQAKELHRRPLAGQNKRGFKPNVKWGRLLDSEHAILYLNSRLLVWNIASAELLYTIDQIRYDCNPVLSFNKRYLAVPMTGGVALLNAMDGSSLGFLPGSRSLTPNLAFHPDGKRVAVTSSNQLIMYDLEAGQELGQTVLPNVISGQPVGWVGDNYLLDARGGLLRTDLGLSVWSYQLNSSTLPCLAPGGIVLAVEDNICQVAALPIPHRAAQVAAAQFAGVGGDALMAVRAGSSVSLQVETMAGSDAAEVEKMLREVVERTGWKIVPKADIVVAATTSRGPKQTIEYRSISAGASGARAPTQTASITPFIATLEVRQGGAVLWSRVSKNYAPAFVVIKAGETLQDAVKEFERPDPAFFGRLKLPPRIPSKQRQFGVGSSSFKNFRWEDSPYTP